MPIEKRNIRTLPKNQSVSPWDQIVGYDVSDNLIKLFSAESFKGENGSSIDRIEVHEVLSNSVVYNVFYTDLTQDQFSIPLIPSTVPGPAGRGIVSIALTGTSGVQKTYTITYSDATTSNIVLNDWTPGESIQMRKWLTHIEYKYPSQSEWTPVISLAEMKGDAWTPAKNIELQATETHIQWRYVGETWQNVIALSLLEGMDWQDPEFRMNPSNIQELQYKLVSSSTWITLYTFPVASVVDWANVQNKPTEFNPSTHTHTFASLSSKPTTISWYGITDAPTANLSTISQAEAGTWTATTVRGWTAERVRQAILAWWATISSNIATLTGAETLTNKTLTLPVFTNGAISFNAPEWFLINWQIERSVKNLIVNNSFETDVSNWGYGSWAVITQDTTEYYHWSASMKVDFTSNNWYIETYNPWKIWQKFVYSLYVKWTAGKKIAIWAWWQWNTWEIILTWNWQRIVFPYISVNANNTIVLENVEWSPHTIYVDAVQVEEWTLTASDFTPTVWNLTVALKTLAWTDPSTTDPVYCRIDWVVRTITSASSDTFPAWTNWRNAWSPELATKEIDYFCYIWIDNLNNIRFWVSRVPNWNNQNDFSASGTYANEKYLMDYWTSFKVTNIWRFNAILSGSWSGHQWSIPATSIIINRPIYETRWLDYAPSVIAWSSTWITTLWARYISQEKICTWGFQINIPSPDTSINEVIIGLPVAWPYYQSAMEVTLFDNWSYVNANATIDGTSITFRKIWWNFTGFLVLRWQFTYETN